MLTNSDELNAGYGGSHKNPLFCCSLNPFRFLDFYRSFLGRAEWLAAIGTPFANFLLGDR